MVCIKHAACDVCIHSTLWPAGGCCTTCFYNGGLVNSFTPPKDPATGCFKRRRRRKRKNTPSSAQGRP